MNHGRRTWQALKESLALSISSSSSHRLQCIHARVITSGLCQNLYLSSLLISKYFSFNLPKIAGFVFDTQLSNKPSKTLVWNSMIKGYLSLSMPHESLEIYHQMFKSDIKCKPDRVTFHLALKACAQLGDFETGISIGRETKANGFESDLLISTPLIGLYVKSGEIESARDLFDKMPQRDIVAWNAMISGYSEYGYLSESLILYKEMKFILNIFPTEATLVSLISCFQNYEIKVGEMIHGHIVKIGFESNLNISNSLIEMYISCDNLSNAVKLFNNMLIKDEVSFSTLIGGYIRDGSPNYALYLFHKMIFKFGLKPTRPILVNAIIACSYLGDLNEGKYIEKNYIFNNFDEFCSDKYLITAVIYMHAKCKNIGTSFEILNKFEFLKKDIIAWNAIMKACEEIGEINIIFEIYFELQRNKINPDLVTFLLLLSVISTISYLKKGIEIHAEIIKLGFETKNKISNSLINMYAKCGKIEDSNKIFNYILQKDVISWCSIIQAYALNGDIKNAFDIFEKMNELKIKLNEYTFLALLSACRNTGNIKRAEGLFINVREKYNIEPKIEHFTCFIDTLSRAGNFAYPSKVFNSILQQGIEKYGNNPKLWGAILNNSRLIGDLKIGEMAANKLLKLEPNNVATYKMLGETYILLGRRDDANYNFELLENMKLDKRPGLSWLEGG